MTPEVRLNAAGISTTAALPPLADAAVPAALVVRNEMARLPDTVAHHRLLGVGPFLIVDNGSTDGTDAWAAAQPDVVLLRAAGSYAASRFGMDWINAILDAVARDRWALFIDADEQLVLPGGPGLSVQALAARLGQEGAEAMPAVMVDMYPAGPLTAARPGAGQRLIALAPMFDAVPYHEQPWPGEFPPRMVEGGVRERLLFPRYRRHPRLWRQLHDLLRWLERHGRGPFSRLGGRLKGDRPPLLLKVPLVRWRAGMAFTNSSHRLAPCRLSAAQGALLHFKFLADFHDRAAEEVRRNEHHNNASEYRVYLDYLSRHPAGNLVAACSQRLAEPDQLLALGYLRDPWGRGDRPPTQDERTGSAPAA